VTARFAGSNPTRYTPHMRFDVRFSLAFVLLVPCVSLACVEKQESAPQQQQATPPPSPQSDPASGAPQKSKFEGMQIKKGTGIGMGAGNTPLATPPPPPPGSTAPTVSASASK
jgi:hypothetical protein